MEENTNKEIVVKQTTAITTTEDVMREIEGHGTPAEQAEKLCRWAAARAGVIVVAPLLGTAALIANEIYLVTKMAKVYNAKISEGAVAGFLGAVGASVAGNLLTTLIPLSVIQIPVAVGLTYAVGKVAQAWIEDGMPKDVAKYKPMLEMWIETAKAEAKEFAADPLKNIPLGDEKKDMLKEKANKAKTILTETSERAKEKASEAKDLLGAKAEVAKEKAAEARTAFGEKAEDARAKVEEKVEEARAKVEEKVADVKDKIQK